MLRTTLTFGQQREAVDIEKKKSKAWKSCSTRKGDLRRKKKKDEKGNWQNEGSGDFSGKTFNGEKNFMKLNLWGRKRPIRSSQSK